LTPLGWTWVLVVWAYCLVWFLIEDRAKLACYRVFNWAEPGLLTKKR